MSSIIKYNRINQLGTIQLGEPKKREDVRNKGINEAISEVISEKNSHEYTQTMKEIARLKEEATKEANDIIERAKEEATLLVSKAKQEEEAILQAAHLELHQQKEAIELEKQGILSEAEAQKEALLLAAEEEKRALLATAEPEVVNILKTLLSRIIDKQIVGSGQWLNLIVRKMIATENITEPIKIYLSEESYEAYKEWLQDKLEDFQYPVTIEIDRQLEKTACAVETSTGIIYYDIKNGLDEVLNEIDMLQNISE